MQIIILFYYFMVTNRPACIPIADLSGNRLRFGSKRMKSILDDMSPVHTELMQMKRW